MNYGKKDKSKILNQDYKIKICNNVNCVVKELTKAGMLCFLTLEFEDHRGKMSISKLAFFLAMFN